MSKSNPFRATKKNGHFTCESGGWRWEVWKVNKAGPLGTSFCKVYSPICPEGEMGDVYNAKIPNFALEFNKAASVLA